MATNNKKKSEKKETSETPGKAADELFVIGIGASAGGLQALDAFFSKVPLDSIAYVIVQHLSSDHCSLLSELLAQHSVLQVIEARHNEQIEANKVYVIPNNQELVIKNNHLLLRGKTAWGRPRTIDTFFKSLAADKGLRSVGIILSGTGTDGTEGVVAIKKAGGMVLVQDPDTARFDGMPRSAINTGYADVITAPELMPQEVFNFVKVTPIANEVTELVNGESEASFFLILELIHDRTGLDFSNYKRPTIIRRISRRMAITNNYSLVTYLDYLNLHPEEVETLSKEFLIGVTKFFRDQEAYEVLAEKVIPAIIDNKTKNDQVRVWIAGCSTGEEAYSIAILIREYLDKVKKELEVKIFASDIDRDALETASRGIYPLNCIAEVSADRLNDFFVKEEGKYRVSQRIRRMVIFAPHNVLSDPPFSKIDLLSCRNMLIYLNPVLQQKVMEKFHYALQINGFLFLGSSESIGSQKGFSEVNKKWKIFRNTEPARTLVLEAFSGRGLNSKNLLTQAPAIGRANPRQALVQHNFSELLTETILDEYQYAGVFIDDHFEILHGVGRFKNYLSLPDNNFTINLLKLVPPDLSVNLNTLLHKAIRDKEKVAEQGIQVREGNTLRYINVVVKPYFTEKQLYQKLILVLFGEEQPPVQLQTPPVYVSDEGKYEQRVNELELDLQHTRQDLQAVVEEFETANVELQSTNEELLSSNEELQSTNEELQSLNEELHTINAEHQYKIKALVELDNDLNNYFRSTDIGQIFVDRKLLIRKYTPAATRLINLIESDVGRSIYHISNNLRYENLIEDIRQVINSTDTLEREVQDKKGTWYQMRVLPYITQERKIDGAIVIFVQINELKNLQLMQAGIFDGSPNAILVLKAIRNSSNTITDFKFKLINREGQDMLGRPEALLQGKSVLKHLPELLEPDLFNSFAQVVETGEQLQTEQQQTYNGKKLWMLLVAVKLDDGLVLNLKDITDRVHYERELLRQNQEIQLNSVRFRMMFEAFPHIAWTYLPNGRIESFNQMWLEYTGLSPEAAQDFSWLELVHPDERRQTKREFKDSLATGRMLNTQVRLRRHSDNQYRWQLVQMVPTRNPPDGDIHQWIGTATDIHDQKEAEEANILLRVSQQREILNAVMQTQEDERHNISEALHNGIGQILYAAKLNISSLNPENETQKQAKERVEKLIEDGIKVSRNISYELTPSVLKDFGLKTAIKEMVSRISHPNLKIYLEIRGFEKRVDYLKEVSLYRIIQELLNNIIRHSHASSASVKMTCKDDQVTLRIQDNGIGFNLEELNKQKGTGIRSIRNRIEMLDGNMELEAAAGEGTSVKIRCSL